MLADEQLPAFEAPSSSALYKNKAATKAATPASEPLATLTISAGADDELDVVPPVPDEPPEPPVAPPPLAEVVDELDRTTVELPPTLTVKEEVLPYGMV